MNTFKHFAIIAVLMLVIFATVSSVCAKMFIETFVTSGQVVTIDDNIITLDDGYQYMPKTKKSPRLSIEEEQMVSIRYIIDAGGDRIYIEISDGEDSLSEIEPPESTQRPESKL